MKVIAYVRTCHDCMESHLELHPEGVLDLASQPWLTLVELPDELVERYWAANLARAEAEAAICVLFGAEDLDDLDGRLDLMRRAARA